MGSHAERGNQGNQGRSLQLLPLSHDAGGRNGLQVQPCHAGRSGGPHLDRGGVAGEGNCPLTANTCRWSIEANAGNKFSCGVRHGALNRGKHWLALRLLPPLTARLERNAHVTERKRRGHPCLQSGCFRQANHTSQGPVEKGGRAARYRPLLPPCRLPYHLPSVAARAAGVPRMLCADQCGSGKRRGPGRWRYQGVLDSPTKS